MSLNRFLAKSARPACKNHPGAEAETSCANCLSPVCGVCAIRVKDGVRCPQCIHGGRTLRFVGTAAALVLAAGAALAIHRLRAAPDATVTPGTAAKDRLEKRLLAEPCDRGKMYEFASQLMQAGENREALRRADAFFARCGDDPRLRGLTYTAHSDLSEWDAAAAEATKLIETDPNDARYWSWRGLAREQKGELATAAEDFEQALAIDPKLAAIPFNLERTYEKLGRPCEGIGPIEQFLHHNPKSRDARTESLLARLYASEGCSGMSGSGQAIIHFPPGAKQITTVVKIDSRPGQFVVDTGATNVVISSTFAKAAGIDTKSWRSVRVQTAGGLRKAKRGVLAEVEVQGVKAKQVEAIVSDELGTLRGLLGQSFLARFDVKIDSGKGILEISARKAKKPVP